MGKPDVDETEIAAGAKAICYHYDSVIGEGQARNIAYVVLCAARGAKSDLERTPNTKPEYLGPDDNAAEREVALSKTIPRG